jgi:hypothetical protein
MIPDFIPLCILALVLMLGTEVAEIKATIEQQYIDRLPQVEEIALKPKSERMYYLFKTECLWKYGPANIDRYLNCTEGKMRTYLASR